MFQRVGNRLRAGADGYGIAVSEFLQELPVPLDTVGQDQRRAAESDMVHTRMQQIFKRSVEFLPRSLDLAGLSRIAYHQIGRHESDSLGSHSIKLIRQYLRTSRR